MRRPIPAKYYRLYRGGHIVGFKRIISSYFSGNYKNKKETTEYLSLEGHCWTQNDPISYDSEISLYTPPAAIAVLKREKSTANHEKTKTEKCQDANN